jgi:hypothetical protein
MFTGDVSYLFMGDALFKPEGGPMTAEVLERHIGFLASCGVDTYLTNPNANGNWYASKRTPRVFDGYRRGDKAFFREHVLKCDGFAKKTEEEIDARIGFHMRFLENYVDLMEAGVDWIAVVAGACRKHGMSPWATVRMNDVHGVGAPEGSYFNAPVYKEKENRLSGGGMPMQWPNRERGQWNYFIGLNYAREAVRKFMLDTIAEMIEEYDHDGIELDWLRNPMCLEIGGGSGASDEGRAMMVDFHREVREMGRKKERRTGRPFLVQLRVPPNFELMRHVGVDVKEIVKAGYADSVAVSNFYQTSWVLPYEEYRREFGVDVALVGVLEGVPNWVAVHDEEGQSKGWRYVCYSPEVLCGNAASKVAAGVDAIEVFNFFGPGKPAPGSVPGTAMGSGYSSGYGELRNLADAGRLGGRVKTYSFAGTGRGGPWVPPYEAVEEMPLVLEPGWRRELKMSMLGEAAGCEFVVELMVKKVDVYPMVTVSFNGGWPVTEFEVSEEMVSGSELGRRFKPGFVGLRFKVKAREGVKCGLNTLVIHNAQMWDSKEESRVKWTVVVENVDVRIAGGGA